MFPLHRPPGMASQQQFHDQAFHQTSPELDQSQQLAFQEPKNHDMIYDMIIKVYGSRTPEHTILHILLFNIYLSNQNNGQNLTPLRNLQQKNIATSDVCKTLNMFAKSILIDFSQENT